MGGGGRGWKDILGLGRRGAAVLEEGMKIPFPVMDLRKTADPIPAILSAREYAKTVRFFQTTPGAERALIPPAGQALLYAVIQNLRPEHVVEIGTSKGGTTETLALAIQGLGFHAYLHTASPYDAAHFLPVYHHWPLWLRRPVRYYQVDSMTLFMRLDQRRVRPGVVVIDGARDYEFALFDVMAAARRLSRGGFIFINGAAQTGPYLAATDFLKLHPEWADCGAAPATGADSGIKVFDNSRSRVPSTDFIVLRAPYEYVVGARPETRGEIEWSGSTVRGLRLTLAGRPGRGTMFAQCILRGVGETKTTEAMAEASLAIDGETGAVDLTFTGPLTTDGGMDRYVVEPCLAWRGDSPLKLLREVEPF